MFSYRHAFHAGNHADVLKHTVLLATLRYMTQKDTALNVFDTHAGAGLYRLDGDFAKTSEEAAEGFLKLVAKSSATPFAPALQDYVDVIASFNNGKHWSVYPGSPFIIQSLLRERDKLKLYELHPTDTKTLIANIAQLEAGRQVAILREDGFEGSEEIPATALTARLGIVRPQLRGERPTMAGCSTWWRMHWCVLPPAPTPSGTPSFRAPTPTTCPNGSRPWPTRPASRGCMRPDRQVQQTHPRRPR